MSLSTGCLFSVVEKEILNDLGSCSSLLYLWINSKYIIDFFLGVKVNWYVHALAYQSH